MKSADDVMGYQRGRQNPAYRSQDDFIKLRKKKKLRFWGSSAWQFPTLTTEEPNVLVSFRIHVGFTDVLLAVDVAYDSA